MTSWFGTMQCTRSVRSQKGRLLAAPSTHGQRSPAPEDFERANAEVQAALRGEREFASEFRIVWPDGSVHFIKADSQTFRDEAGRAVRMIGVNYDITERKLAEERTAAKKNLRH